MFKKLEQFQLSVVHATTLSTTSIRHIATFLCFSSFFGNKPSTPTRAQMSEISGHDPLAG